MSTNAIFFAWDRAIAGREKLSSAHFDDFFNYLLDLKNAHQIVAFDTVFLEQHGGDMNGFFLIKGEPAKLDGLTATEEWQNHMVRAGMHLQHSGAVRAKTGDSAIGHVKMWREWIPE